MRGEMKAKGISLIKMVLMVSSLSPALLLSFSLPHSTALSSVCFLKTSILPTSKSRNEPLPFKFSPLVFTHTHTHSSSVVFSLWSLILPLCLFDRPGGAEERKIN